MSRSLALIIAFVIAFVIAPVAIGTPARGAAPVVDPDGAFRLELAGYLQVRF